MNGVRFWNVKHPTAYAQRLTAGESPAAGHEVLSEQEKLFERILLQTRLRSGLATRVVDRPDAVDECLNDGLIEAVPAAEGRIVLTLRGRMLADIVARRLTD